MIAWFDNHIYKKKKKVIYQKRYSQSRERKKKIKCQHMRILSGKVLK